MTILSRVSLSAIWMLSAIDLYASQVTMKNGDRLTGVILKSDEKVLTMKSDYAGPVNLPWDAVAAIISSEPLNVGLQDGQILVGPVTASEGKFQIATKETGNVSAAKESIKTGKAVHLAKK